MQLIGMLDSPYVRRVAISLKLLRLPFEHRPLSVFRTFEEFRAINPVVKAPTLVCTDGTVLMDSTLILDYAEGLSARAGGPSLMPVALPARQSQLRIIGLGLAACEKSVQLIYERELRPPEKQHEPWITRVGAQMRAAFAALEGELARARLASDTAGMTQAGVTSAVAWHFAQALLPQLLPAGDYVHLAAFSAEAERLASFREAPHGDGTVH